MRITRIELFKAALALKRPFRIAIGETSVSESIFVRLHTESGIYGMGEGNILTAVVGETADSGWSAAQQIARHLIGSDATEIERRVAQMRALVPGHPATRSAFDMALHDVVGKSAGLPLYALLGGGRRTLVTDNTIGIDTPETMAAIASEFAAQGFPAIKIKLGTSPGEDTQRVRAVRDAIGPEKAIRLDANQGWSRIEAIQVLRAVSEVGIEYCEQPVAAWDVEGMAHVRAAATVPIMADESLFDDHDAVALIRADACDYFNIKLSKSSGLFVANAINAIAEAAGIPCMIGCMTESRLGLSAAAHLMSARPNILFADLDGGLMLQDDPVTGGVVYRKGGELAVPERPGLGVDLEESFIVRLPTSVFT